MNILVNHPYIAHNQHVDSSNFDFYDFISTPVRQAY